MTPDILRLQDPVNQVMHPCPKCHTRINDWSVSCQDLRAVWDFVKLAELARRQKSSCCNKLVPVLGQSQLAYIPMKISF